MTPAAVGVDPAAEGVHAGVEVRTDANAVHPCVVSYVDDSRELMLAGTVGKGAEPQQVLHAQQKPCAADSADQNGDLHNVRH